MSEDNEWVGVMTATVVGYMFHGSRHGRAPGVWVLHERCALRVFGSATFDAPIYRENIGSYSQTCHECDESIVAEGVCELFVKPTSTCSHEKYDGTSHCAEMTCLNYFSKRHPGSIHGRDCTCK